MELMQIDRKLEIIGHDGWLALTDGWSPMMDSPFLVRMVWPSKLLAKNYSHALGQKIDMDWPQYKGEGGQTITFDFSTMGTEGVAEHKRIKAPAAKPQYGIWYGHVYRNYKWTQQPLSRECDPVALAYAWPEKEAVLYGADGWLTNNFPWAGADVRAGVWCRGELANSDTKIYTVMGFDYTFGARYVEGKLAGVGWWRLGAYDSDSGDYCRDEIVERWLIGRVEARRARAAGKHKRENGQ